MKKNITQIANNYAQALFEIGTDFVSDLKQVQEVINTSADFKNVVFNPSIDINLKYSIVDKIFESKISPEVLKFLKILILKNRFNEFDNICESYILKIEAFKDIQPVQIISAIQISDKKKSEIEQKLSKKLDKKIVPDWIVDESVIAGLVIKIGDDVIDTSLKKSLDDISKNIR